MFNARGSTKRNMATSQNRTIDLTQREKLYSERQKYLNVELKPETLSLNIPSLKARLRNKFDISAVN